MDTLLNHYRQSLKRVGKLCTVNGTRNITCIIKEIEDGLKGIDSKHIITADTLNQGDIITYNGASYLTLTMNERVNNIYGIYTIRKCPSAIKFDFNNDGSIKNFDFIVDSKIFDINTGMINTVDNQIYIIIQHDVNSALIKISDRFIKFSTAWKIIGINKTVEGLIKFTCQSDYFTDYDDKVNEIAYSSAPITPPVETHIYELTVNPTTISIIEDDTIQVNATVTDNGNTIENPTIIYSTSNADIATISSDGLITGIAEGNCTITVNYRDLTKTITAVVSKATPIHNYVLSVTPLSVTMDIDATTQITASVTDNGVNGENAVFNYSSDNNSLITIDNIGLITAVAEGACNITVSFVGEDNITYTQTVSTVINAPAPVGIVVTANPSSITNAIGRKITVTYTVTNNGVDITGDYWFMTSSTNESVATIYSEDGNRCVINVRGSGSCDINAVCLDWDYNTVGTAVIHVS